jgi:hypothetical protein
VLMAMGLVACNSGSPASPSAFPSGGGATAIAGTAHTAGPATGLSFGSLSHDGSDGPLEVCVVDTDVCAVADASGQFELVGDFAGDVQLHFSGDGHDVIMTIHDVQPGQRITVTVTLNGHTGTLDVESRERVGERIALCHVEGNGSYHRIEVSLSAEEDHLDHGDGHPSGEVPGTDPALFFDDDCNVLGPEIDIEKSTNGEDADRGSGPKIPVGDPVMWTYVVTNTGTVALTGIVVEDDDEGIELDCDVEIPASLVENGDSFQCTAESTAIAGRYSNVGTVTATAGDVEVTDSDASHYVGQEEEDDGEENGAKVELCHRTGNDSYRLIEVSVDAEPAHMAHGDMVPVDGTCPVSGPE